MSLVLSCNIEIGKYRFMQVHHVEIRKSWRELASTANIQLPLKNKLEKLIFPGDKVKVTLSYVGYKEHEEFVGYVTRTKPNYPFEVECEDNVYLLKKTNVNKNWAGSVKLKEIVNYVIDQVKIKYPTSEISVSGELPTVTFDKFRVANTNAAQVLAQLKDHYGLSSFFQGTQLFVGLANQVNTGQSVKYSLVSNIIESDLTYRKADEVRIKVRVIGITKDNKRFEPKDVVGDGDGEQRTIFIYNMTNVDDLKKRALEELNRLKFDGYDGTFTTFLIPYAEPLQVAEIKDPKYETREGRYLIDSVVTTFGMGGARRVVEPGRKV